MLSTSLATRIAVLGAWFGLLIFAMPQTVASQEHSSSSGQINPSGPSQGEGNESTISADSSGKSQVYGQRDLPQKQPHPALNLEDIERRLLPAFKKQNLVTLIGLIVLAALIAGVLGVPIYQQNRRIQRIELEVSELTNLPNKINQLLTQLKNDLKAGLTPVVGIKQILEEMQQSSHSESESPPSNVLKSEQIQKLEAEFTQFSTKLDTFENRIKDLLQQVETNTGDKVANLSLEVKKLREILTKKLEQVAQKPNASPPEQPLAVDFPIEQPLAKEKLSTPRPENPKRATAPEPAASPSLANPVTLDQKVDTLLGMIRNEPNREAIHAAATELLKSEKGVGQLSWDQALMVLINTLFGFRESREAAALWRNSGLMNHYPQVKIVYTPEGKIKKPEDVVIKPSSAADPLLRDCLIKVLERAREEKMNPSLVARVVRPKIEITDATGRLISHQPHPQVLTAPMQTDEI
jgi:regulator of replication initiation timing